MKLFFELNENKNGLVVTGGEDDEEQLMIPSEQVFEGKTCLVTEIRARAFSSCTNTKELIIPKTIRWIDGDAFASSGLEKICVDDDNPFYCSVNGIVYNKSQTLLVAAAPLLARDMMVVPEGVQKIAEGAFRGCVYLTDIILPESLVIIGDDAFRDCHRLTAINIPDSVTKTFALGECPELYSITIPSSVKRIDGSAFDSSEFLQKIIIADSSLLKDVWLPDNVEMKNH